MTNRLPREKIDRLMVNIIKIFKLSAGEIEGMVEELLDVSREIYEDNLTEEEIDHLIDVMENPIMQVLTREKLPKIAEECFSAGCLIGEKYNG